MQLLLRFFIGGVLVSIFAVLGDSFKPKSFAGLFGAAPSIALAGLVLVWLSKGAAVVAAQAHAMVYGSAALVIYCMTCTWFVKYTKDRPWLLSGLLWIEWLFVAAALYKAGLQ